MIVPTTTVNVDPLSSNADTIAAPSKATINAMTRVSDASSVMCFSSIRAIGRATGVSTVGVKKPAAMAIRNPNITFLSVAHPHTQDELALSIRPVPSWCKFHPTRTGHRRVMGVIGQHARDTYHIPHDPPP